MRRVRYRGHVARRGLSATRAIAPGVVPLLEAYHLGSEVGPVVQRLAAEYAGRGQSLETYVDDVEACFDAIGQGPMTNAMVRSAGLAWGDTYAGRFAQVSCRDAESGLNSIHHLQSHIQTLFAPRTPAAQGGLRAVRVPATDYAVLVVELPVEHASAASMSIANEELRAGFPHATMFATLANRRSAALIRRTPDLTMLIRRLDRVLADRITVAPAHARPRVWIEGLPSNGAAAADMVSELSR